MIRTTVALEEQVYKKARIEAIERRVSFGQVINEVLENHYEGKKEEKRKITGNEFLNRLANYHLKGGPKDLAQNLDKYLWDKYDR